MPARGGHRCAFGNVPGVLGWFLPYVGFFTRHFLGEVESVHAGPTLSLPEQQLRILGGFSASDYPAHHTAGPQPPDHGPRLKIGDPDHVLRTEIIVERSLCPPVADRWTERTDTVASYPDALRFGIVEIDPDIAH